MPRIARPPEATPDQTTPLAAAPCATPRRAVPSTTTAPATTAYATTTGETVGCGTVSDASRATAPAPARRRLRTAATVTGGSLLAAVTLMAAATLLPGSPDPAPPPPYSAARGTISYGTASGLGSSGATPDVSASIAGLQRRLHRLPKDYVAWAELGSAYVQRSRQTADPSYYVKAEQATARSLKLSPGNFAGLTAEAALAAGRHDFARAVRLSRDAIAANPYGPIAYGVAADAYTQLGQYGPASEAIGEMIDLAPGVSSFTRASYDAELRGDQTAARRLLDYALRDAFTPADIAYCRYYLGELALHAGDGKRAASMYAAALKADPSFVPALAGKARAAALDGRLREAATGYEAVVERLPLSQYLIEYGEVLQRMGGDPSTQWKVLAAQRDLMRANGVRDDLTWAEFEADHGSPARAVQLATAEYARNPNVVAADALAWALYRDGKPRQALPYARKATATGWRNALLVHHRAEIERALGVDTSESSALVRTYNPRFEPRLPALQRFS
ncbi:hypothetical protein N5079_02915 [Planotetraspora sp. A-T 1434]|uniref:tetratricopeptide repeat protein n=1 Tax=Planotetraspora sp. A-T 1434 TaxID=2979219 RepID=UPI0021C042C2|nr:hypothetical protein [Planotetraspora sp. A-T 1434]MCT9929167.1 hypothetical protein [Planotetraspora sp. A-T 1434]